jgi:hypothetical protein
MWQWPGNFAAAQALNSVDNVRHRLLGTLTADIQ